jgi:hypothetical protein
MVARTLTCSGWPDLEPVVLAQVIAIVIYRGFLKVTDNMANTVAMALPLEMM